MSNDEFESWLSLVGRLLGLSDRQRKQISEELRDHLEMRVADLMEDGMERSAAVMKAVEEFGDAAVLAKNLQSVSLTNQKRWMMRFMTLATAALFFLAVLTMAMWPEKARFGSPSQSVAQEDPFADGDSPKTGNADASAKKEKPKPSSRTQTKMQIRELLEKPTDLVFDADPFGDIREELSRRLKLNIVIDQHLEGVLDDNTEVSANLVGVTMADGLRAMLKPIDATYTIKDGVLLLISTDDEMEPDYLSRHMIDVRELLELIKSTEAVRLGGKAAVAIEGAGGKGGGGIFSVDPDQAAQEGGEDAEVAKVEELAGVVQTHVIGSTGISTVTAEQMLIDAIMRVVYPDAWQQSGTGNCDLTCIGGVLVLVSHESLASEVRDFVVDLEYQIKNRD